MKNKPFVPKEPTLADSEIIELYWNRQESAIEETDRKYGRYLFTVAYNIVHDRLDCEECVNDTYLGTWNRIPPTRPSVFQAFITRITRNIAVDRFRYNTASCRIPSELTVALNELDDCILYQPSEEDELRAAELAEILNSYLASLSSRREFIFVCRYYYADTLSDIADRLGISRNTVIRELSRIRSGLRKRLEQGGFFI